MKFYNRFFSPKNFLPSVERLYVVGSSSKNEILASSKLKFISWSMANWVWLNLILDKVDNSLVVMGVSSFIFPKKVRIRNARLESSALVSTLEVLND